MGFEVGISSFTGDPYTTEEFLSGGGGELSKKKDGGACLTFKRLALAVLFRVLLTLRI